MKQHYTNDRVERMAYKDNPLLALMPKYEQFGGDVLKLPVIHGDPQGRAVTIAQAQATKTPSQLKAFLLTRSKDYAVASIQNEVLEASKGNANAFMEASTTEIDGAIHSLTRALAIDLYRTGSGSRGQCNANATGTSLVLKNADDVTNFEVNQELVFSTADGGGTVKSGSVTVVGVDRDAGVLTVDALSAIDSGTGVAANDYIFIQGDYDLKIKGVQAWIPNTAPSSTSFFGVDRTADVTRLGGIRFDGSSMPIEEALIAAASRAAREGAKPSHCFMNYTDYTDLEKALGKLLH